VFKLVNGKINYFFCVNTINLRVFFTAF